MQGWISVDGKVIAHIYPHSLRKLTLSLPETNEGRHERKTLEIVQPRSDQKIPAGAEVGTFMDFPQACWQYLHESVNESLHSSDPLVSALAMLNGKVGNTRLQRALAWDLHPLTRAMLDFRLDAERAIVAEKGVRGRN